MNKNLPKSIQASSRPRLQGASDPTCPILHDAKTTLEKSQDLLRAIRKLRGSTQRCSTCPQAAECPVIQYFANALGAAIREVRQEWGEEGEP